MSALKIKVLLHTARKGNRDATRALAGEAAKLIQTGKPLPIGLDSFIADALLKMSSGERPDTAFGLSGRSNRVIPAKKNFGPRDCSDARRRGRGKPFLSER